ncbi:hypothetical protein V5O48_013636 [Marasmius crinis-equi]|uniref:Uncharacterized protein n=1 Tax=Marasmius crinis-equi TaxID=585013 RepID=A0ABR3EZJ2_9AGAR
MAALASAADPWRARFYCRTEFKGGAIVDDRGSASKGCTNIPDCNPPNGVGARSMQFENNPPPTCAITVFTGAGCTGTSKAYTGTTNVADFSAVSPPGAPVRSYRVDCPPLP